MRGFVHRIVTMWRKVRDVLFGPKRGLDDKVNTPETVLAVLRPANKEGSNEEDVKFIG